MSVKDEDKKILEDHGYIPLEIEELNKAYFGKDENDLQPPINLSSPHWVELLRSRLAWINDKLSRGWTLEEAKNSILFLYQHNKKMSIYDLVGAVGSITESDLERLKKTKPDYLEARSKKDAT